MQAEHLAHSSSVNHCSLFPTPFSQHLLTREGGEGSWVPRKGPWTRNQRWGLQSQLFHPQEGYLESSSSPVPQFPHLYNGS